MSKSPPIKPTFVSSIKDILPGLSEIICGELLWISGPPGSGKTTFLCELANAYPKDRFLYLTSREPMKDYIASMNRSSDNLP